jgi:hypothetical protein
MTTVARIRLFCCFVAVAGELAHTSGRWTAQHGWVRSGAWQGRMAVWSRWPGCGSGGGSSAA